MSFSDVILEEGSDTRPVHPRVRRLESLVGFNPYLRIRRARMTRRGDVLFVVFFLALVAAALVWAMR